MCRELKKDFNIALKINVMFDISMLHAELALCNLYGSMYQNRKQKKTKHFTTDLKFSIR